MKKQNSAKAVQNPKEVKKDKPADRIKFVWYGILVLLFFLLTHNKAGAGKNADSQEEIAESPDFDLPGWFGGCYQEKAENYLKANSVIGKELLPLKNQLDYTVFGKYNMEDYVRGNNNYLISESGIYSYLGKNYLGDSTINEKVRKLKVISDKLKSKNIDLVILFAPTKEYAMPELIPGKYLKYKKRKNNYEAYIEGFRKCGINYLDLQPFIQHLKRSYQYPIYPQYGTHMSYFTECMVADTVIKYIQHLRGVVMPHLAWKQIDYPSSPRMRDADAIAKAKLKVMPHSIPLAYPAVGFTSTQGARPVRTLGIGDSYYRSFMYLGVAQVAFGNGEYWYYYNSVVPETPNKTEVWEYDLKAKLEENEVVLLYYASGNLHRLGDGFIEDAYELYTNPSSYYERVKRETPLKKKIKLVHESPEQLDDAKCEATKLDIPLDSAIKLKAEMVEE